MYTQIHTDMFIQHTYTLSLSPIHILTHTHIHTGTFIHTPTFTVTHTRTHILRKSWLPFLVRADCKDGGVNRWGVGEKLGSGGVWPTEGSGQSLVCVRWEEGAVIRLGNFLQVCSMDAEQEGKDLQKVRPTALREESPTELKGWGRVEKAPGKGCRLT